jgi:hypothetical protein
MQRRLGIAVRLGVSMKNARIVPAAGGTDQRARRLRREPPTARRAPRAGPSVPDRCDDGARQRTRPDVAPARSRYQWTQT